MKDWKGNDIKAGDTIDIIKFIKHNRANEFTWDIVFSFKVAQFKALPASNQYHGLFLVLAPDDNNIIKGKTTEGYNVFYESSDQELSELENYLDNDIDFEDEEGADTLIPENEEDTTKILTVLELEAFRNLINALSPQDRILAIRGKSDSEIEFMSHYFDTV